jgi:hypothetical protein
MKSPVFLLLKNIYVKLKTSVRQIYVIPILFTFTCVLALYETMQINTAASYLTIMHLENQRLRFLVLQP